MGNLLSEYDFLLELFIVYLFVAVALVLKLKVSQRAEQSAE